MPAGRPRSVPTYRHHRQSGQAVVTLTDGCGNRRDVLLGTYGTKASREEYARVLSEWEAAGRCPPQPVGAAATLTINELLVRFMEWAEQHYRHTDGRPTSELNDYRYTLKPLKELYGTTTAARFGPLALKAVRQKMLDTDLSRGVANQRTGRIKRVFKWAVAEELVPQATYAALVTVEGLARGRTAARETEPVGPVSPALVEIVKPRVNRYVRAMIDMQSLTGMRPGEVVIMRACDIDTSGKVWLYRPHHHKLAYQNRERVIALGPKSQDIVKAFRVPELDTFLFSPGRAREERFAELRAKRRTPVPPSQQCRKKRRPSKRPGRHYSARSYHRAIADACRKAGAPGWHPNQLRHLHATEIRRQFGLEAAQVVLGHSKADVTQVYAERDLGLAVRIAAQVG
jgi:integrase